jgi:hypothetical protein
MCVWHIMISVRSEIYVQRERTVKFVTYTVAMVHDPEGARPLLWARACGQKVHPAMYDESKNITLTCETSQVSFPMLQPWPGRVRHSHLMLLRKCL